MRYKCNRCEKISDEGDLIEDDIKRKVCPDCACPNMTEIDDSEYGN